VPDAERLRPHWFQILLALAGGAMHGTAVMEEVLERTEGEMKLWPGTLYGSLRDLSAQRWIRETDVPDGAPTEGGRRRFYELTAAGRTVLADEVERLADYVRVARARRVVEDAEPA
jgi:DNA-binding PadR family transcriptional regulator